MTKTEQIADVAAGFSIATFLGLSMSDWDTLIHIIAGIVAIIAGVSAAVFHIARTVHLHRNK